MNYQSLYDFFHDISQNMDITCQFFHGRAETSLLADGEDPLICLSLPFTSTGSFVQGGQADEQYNCIFTFYQRDEADSAIDQNNQNQMQDEPKTLAITNQAADL